MNDLKTAKQFYQASLENLNKANELHEKMEATERKTVALFSRFIDGTKSISGDVELVAKDNLKAIQQRDVLAVINSIIAMTLDMPKPYLAYCSVSSAASSFYLVVWEPSDKKGTPALLEVSLTLDESSVLEDALSLESQLAEFIIKAKRQRRGNSMSKDKFLAKMAIAYMQNHGHAPTENQLSDWSELYVVLERKGN